MAPIASKRWIHSAQVGSTPVEDPFAVEQHDDVTEGEARQSELDHAQKQKQPIQRVRSGDDDRWKSQLLDVRRKVLDKSSASLQHQLSKKEEEELKKAIDYEEMIIETRVKRRDPAALRTPMPWAVPRAQRASLKDGRDVLALEINRFAEWIEPTPTEKAARSAVAQELQSFIDAVLTKGKTGHELIGSEKTGLALPISDVDLRIFDNAEGHTGHRMDSRMKRLVNAMERSSRYITVVFRKGRFPIITCQHRESGIDIQIVATTSTAAQAAVTAQYLEEIPDLRKAFFVIRTFFSMRGLGDTFSGGIGSYGVLIMLAAALGHGRHVNNGNLSGGHALGRFLSFYDCLDTTKYGVAVRPFPYTLFPKHTPTEDPSPSPEDQDKSILAGQRTICERAALVPWLLCLQDPANPYNDLGRNIFATKHILRTIRYCRQWLRRDAERLTKSLATGQMPRKESILQSIVGRCHEVYGERRRILHEYGEKVMQERTVQGQKGLEVRSSGNSNLSASADLHLSSHEELKAADVASS